MHGYKNQILNIWNIQAQTTRISEEVSQVTSDHLSLVRVEDTLNILIETDLVV